MLTTTSHRRLADLPPVKSDSLLALIAPANADSRPEKIDVGVVVYKDGSGGTTVERSGQAAEKWLWGGANGRERRGNVAGAASSGAGAMPTTSC